MPGRRGSAGVVVMPTTASGKRRVCSPPVVDPLSCGCASDHRLLPRGFVHTLSGGVGECQCPLLEWISGGPASLPRKLGSHRAGTAVSVRSIGTGETEGVSVVAMGEIDLPAGGGARDRDPGVDLSRLRPEVAGPLAALLAAVDAVAMLGASARPGLVTGSDEA